MTTRIIVVLDKSGSMNSQRTEVVEGLNKMIKTQREFDQEESSKTKFTLVTFSDIVDEPRETTLNAAPSLTLADYIPEGRTSLYEAIGVTIEKYQSEENVIMIIATDGKENASNPRYTLKLIGEQIKVCKKERNWNFMFLCEDIDQFQERDSLGLTGKRSQSVQVQKGGIGGYIRSNACSEQVCGYRSSYTSK
jgi:hypothetical protein